MRRTTDNTDGADEEKNGPFCSLRTTDSAGEVRLWPATLANRVIRTIRGFKLQVQVEMELSVQTFLTAVLWNLAFVPAVPGDEPKRYSFPLPADFQRADIYVADVGSSSKGVLVLCPGANGNGETLVTDPQWRSFAREQGLGIVGLSFASDERLFPQERGYYYVTQGSGELLLSALRKIYHRDLPLLLYGFSGGAQFTSRFAEWRPERIVAWCAHSAAWWDLPQASRVTSLGIVACGENDHLRYGTSLTYFLQGRAQGKPWTWIGLHGEGHAASKDLQAFARDYFAACLHMAASAAAAWWPA